MSRFCAYFVLHFVAQLCLRNLLLDLLYLVIAFSHPYIDYLRHRLLVTVSSLGLLWVRRQRAFCTGKNQLCV